MQQNSLDANLIQIKAFQINEILNQITIDWNYKWSINIQLLQNKINNHIQQLAGTDIINIKDDSHQKLIIIEFSKGIRKPYPIVRHPIETVDSMKSTLSVIDTDFSILVFKIVNDKAYLVHYLPRQPDFIAYSEYVDSYNTKPGSAFKFEFKQLNWLIHKYSNSTRIEINIFPIGLEVQISCLHAQWYLLIPQQNGRETVCINVNETLSLVDQNIGLFNPFLDPVNRFKYYKFIVIREVLRSLQGKFYPDLEQMQTVLEHLNPELSYNLLVSEQILLNFPISTKGLFVTSVFQKLSNITQDQLPSRVLNIQDHGSLCISTQFQTDITNQLSLKKIRQLTETSSQSAPFNVLLTISNENSNIKQFRLSTQYYLFTELCFAHFQELKRSDQLGSLKDIVHLYVSDFQKNKSNLTIPQYQKLRYPISRLFLLNLHQILQQQELQYNIFVQQAESYLTSLKMVQIVDLFKKYQNALDQIILDHIGTKQSLIKYFIYIIKQNNNSLVVPIISL